MLGVTVDYPVLLIGHRKIGESAGGTLHRIGRAFALAVICAALGLTGMVVHRLPRDRATGAVAAIGVLTAAAMTALVLAPLIAAANLAPVWAGDPGRLLQVEQWRRWRLWGLAPVAAAAVALLAMGGPRWEGDIANLSPIPRATRALDAELRAELGAPDLGDVLVVQGASAEDVLTRQEALLPAIQALRDAHAITGFEAASRLLPSIATQRRRQAALPDGADLQARVQDAAAGLPFQSERVRPVRAGRRRVPHRPPGHRGRSARAGHRRPAARLAVPARWDVVRPDRLHRRGRSCAHRSACRAGGGVRRHACGDERPGRWRRGAGAVVACWPAAGAALVVMLAGLRRPVMVGRIAFRIAASGLVTIAIPDGGRGAAFPAACGRPAIHRRRRAGLRPILRPPPTGRGGAGADAPKPS